MQTFSIVWPGTQGPEISGRHQCVVRGKVPARTRFSWPWMLLACFILGCGPARLDSDEAHKSTDALYTAVTSRRADLLDAVEADLKKLVQEQKLSTEAMAELQSIIELARADSWQQSAEQLDRFIRKQPHRPHAH